MQKVLIGLCLIITTNLFSFDYKLKPKKIAPNVWCLLGHVAVPSDKNGGFMSNNCFIKTEDSYVVVDSGGTYEYAKQAYTVMSKIANLPVNNVISTHEHDDHWLGNAFYKDKFNAKLFGPSSINLNYKPGDKTRLMKMLSKEIMEKTRIVPIDKEITKETTIFVGGVEVKMIPFGYKVHTKNDIFIFLPKTKTIFSGDTVMNQRITSNRDGSLLGQIKAHKDMDLKKWINLVPGHGHNTSKTAMNESKLYFKLLKERIEIALDDDIGADEAQNFVKLPEFKDKVMFDIWNKRNIFDAYNELEFAE